MTNHGSRSRQTRRCARLRCLLLTLVAVVIAFLALPAPARAVDYDYDPPVTEAECAIVCAADGTVLWSLNPTKELQPASITKVMTCMLALDSGIDLDKKVTIVEEPPGGNSQTAGFSVGDTTTLRDLLLATLVYSGNDAALNIATIVAGSPSAFVAQMNARAAELGMTHTHFVNPHGLEQEGHYSCVEDLAKMGRYALENYPFIAQAVRYSSVDLDIGGELVTLESTDELMETYEGLLGIKTGSVESGQGFLGAAKRDGVELYTAVLGCETSDGRFADTAALLDWGFDQAYGWQLAAREGSLIRVLPSATDLAGVRLVRAPRGLGAYAFDDGSAPSFSGRFKDAHLLADAGETTGALTSVQDGRLSGAASLDASNEVYDAPALNTFALPLFDGAITRRAA